MEAGARGPGVRGEPDGVARDELALVVPERLGRSAVASSADSPGLDRELARRELGCAALARALAERGSR
ncbi:MAG: hypothetical protein H6713_14345 [Myxococcales bacterium]|nr:hypothetical protein [Myxococcales bacterium]